MVKEKVIISKINGMRKRGIIIDEEICNYVAEYLTNDKIEELYFMLDMRNSIILLRAIAEQYLCNNKIDLELDVLEEIMYDKCIYNEKIIRIFIAFAENNELSAFVKFCDIINHYHIQI